MSRRNVLLIQLPIPPLGPGRIRGNVPLAAGYLKLYAQLRGLDTFYDLHIFPSHLANTLGDLALVEQILAHDPWMVGFSCYLWNIDRTLWIAERLKERRPNMKVILGGPEITADNSWVLQHPALDFAVIGEGEQTFAELLAALQATDRPTGLPGVILGCHTFAKGGSVRTPETHTYRSAEGMAPKHSFPLSLSGPSFQPRHPLEDLNEISSPYLAGLLDAADEEMLLLETIRGCIFKCKFCYYPKSYTALHFLSDEKIAANLRHARERGAREIVLLDPTLNQRRDFDGFLRLLIDHNRDRRFTCFGELRAEGIKETTAKLLAEAGFTEVEVGLQSIDPLAMQLMDRKNNLKAVERGCRAMLDAGIHVKVDLIIGLPGDTPDSVRRSLHYLRDSGIYSDVQVFNLAVLPGTAFRQEAADLGLVHQPRPPYYVRRTPTLRQEDLFDLMHEASEVFELDWDPLPEPVLPTREQYCGDHAILDLDIEDHPSLPAAHARAQAFTLWLRGSDFTRQLPRACGWIDRLLQETPFTTLQLVLEPTANPTSITSEVLTELWSACQRHPSYLDRYYALQPGRPAGAKRMVVLLRDAGSPAEQWLAEVEQQAAILSDPTPSPKI